MAESAVTFLLDKLSTLLEQEVQLLRGVRGEVRSIKDELQSMRAFLRDADARGESDEGVKAWVTQVRDAAYDTEDILDYFMLRLTQHRQRHGFFVFLQETTRSIMKLNERHRIATQMQDVRVRIREIEARSQRYHFNRIEQGSSSNSTRNTWRDPRGDALLIEEAELVGINKPKEELIGWLVEGESRLGVVSVVGMGGLGKTTLVKKVYDDRRVKGYFKHHAWVTVSQSFKTEELLRDIIAQLFEEIKQPSPQGVEIMNAIRLREQVKNFLQEKRYVIVFDDIWNVDAWDAVKYALPDSKCNSRILITTRSLEICASCSKTDDLIYKLQPLPQKDSWNLFCKKAFQSNLEDSCPPHLEELSRIILRRCEGLPLAIVALGGLLSTKDKTVIEWNTVHHCLGAELESNDKLSSVTKILSLSYTDLPYYLKSCFMCLSIFPEDKLIERMRLIRLWTAEGFIEEKPGRTIEDVAESYLRELISRSLIQIGETTVDRRVKRCRVHDLMRDIILSKSRDENFGTIVDEQNKRVHEKIRRLSIHDSAENVPQNTSFPHIRSLLMFGIDTLSNSSTNAFFGRFRLLNVLDLGGAPLEMFPKEILNLFHLRYLSLRRTKIKALPNSIGKLQNLETLDLKDAYVSELPIGILKLQKLRHLLVYRYEIESYATFDDCKGFKVNEGIGCLIALQKLCYIEANQGSGIIRALGRLTQLKRLCIMKLTREDGIDLCSSIEKMHNLLSLSVTSIEEEILDLQSLSSLPPLLQRLYVRGRLEKLPHWISLLDNLVRLKLWWSGLRNDPLEALQALPNLLDLVLLQAYDGEVLCFKSKGFQRLQILTIDKLDGLKWVIIEEGAMPHLQKLDITRCEALEKVPLGIEHLTNVKELWFYDMPDKFKMQLLPDGGGEDHWKVVHIPTVRFTYWTDKGWKIHRL